MHEISEVLEELCKTVKRVSYEEETAIASAIQKAKYKKKRPSVYFNPLD